jgi:sugar phosphate isomerase/epimerase
VRVGVLARGETGQLDWALSLGFRALEWVRFEEGVCAPGRADWADQADRLGAAVAGRGLRISAIGALYRNPLDPAQTEMARAVFQRAIAVAARLGIKTVAGFPGAVIVTGRDERGGHLVQEPLENHLPQVLAFWEPLARAAADQGVRIAFEHCPQGPYHLPVMHYNLLGQVAQWERLFDATACDNLGLEWDPSHLLCQGVEPLDNLARFGRKIFHVHAKDAWINRPLMARYGICHPGVAEHRFPGLGELNWAQVVHGLLRAGYDSDLSVEGWHDPVYRNHEPGEGTPLAGRQLEDDGLRIARRTLENLVPA